MDCFDWIARRIGSLLRDPGPPPCISCGAGAVFIPTNHLHVGLGLVGVWQCPRPGGGAGSTGCGDQWALFVVEGSEQLKNHGMSFLFSHIQRPRYSP